MAGNGNAHITTCLFFNLEIQIFISDYWKEQREYWYPKLYEKKDPKYLDIFKHHINDENFFYDRDLIENEADHKGMWKARKKHLANFLDIDKKLIQF